ncbi:class I SAM-dependent methyltransferase [Amycolatopsis acididurans]|nr:class I SAM-dependent methyltransferase [Amycolatopsis acididurans]
MAESFGEDAVRYDRARPGYPDELIARVIDAGPGHDVLSVGCGTGIDARQFQAAGCHVLGVDPDARMAEFARRSGVEVEVAKFEDWTPAGRTFDAVVAAQAWHWVDPVAGAAKAAEVLRPKGILAVFAHVYMPPGPVGEAMTEVVRRVLPGSPLGAMPARDSTAIYGAMFAKFADGFRQAEAFAEPEQWRFDWERYYTRDEWLELMPTTGGLTRVPGDKLAEILDAIGAAVDKLGGGFTMPFTTLATAVTKAG